MHEASLAEALLRLALDQAGKFPNPDGQPPRIRKLGCKAGLLTGIEPDALQACFEILAEGTEAEGAVLELEISALDCICRSCGQKFRVARRHFICPHCKSDQIDFSGGAGLVLESIEVECGEKPDE